MRPFLPILGLAFALGLALTNANEPIEATDSSVAPSHDSRAQYWPGHCRLSWNVCKKIKRYERKYCKWGHGQDKVCVTLKWLKLVYCGHRRHGRHGGGDGDVSTFRSGDGEVAGLEEDPSDLPPDEGIDLDNLTPPENEDGGADGANIEKREELERHGGGGHGHGHGHGHGQCKFSWWRCRWIRYWRWYYCYKDYNAGLCWLFKLLYRLYCRWWF